MVSSKGVTAALGSYCCVKHQGFDWPSIICSEKMVPKDSPPKPSAFHQPALLMHKLQFTWILPSDITEYVPSARIHLALRDDAKELYRAYEAVEDSGYSDLTYWQDELLARSMDEEEKIAAQDEARAASEAIDDDLHQSLSKGLNESPRSCILDDFDDDEPDFPTKVRSRITKETKYVKKPAVSKKPAPDQSRGITKSQPKKRDLQKAKVKSKQQKERKARGKPVAARRQKAASPIFCAEDEDDEEILPGTVIPAEMSFLYDDRDFTSSFAGQGMHETGTKEYATYDFNDPFFDAKAGVSGKENVAPYAFTNTQAVPELDTTLYDNPASTPTDFSLFPLKSSDGPQVKLLVGTGRKAHKVRLGSITTRPFLNSMVVRDSRRGLVINHPTLYNLGKEATRSFAAVADFLNTGDFFPPLDVDTGILLGIITEDDQKKELMKFATLFDIGRQLQLNDFMDTVVMKAGALRPWQDEAAAKVTVFLLSTPHSGTMAENTFIDMLAEWLGADLMRLVTTYAKILSDTLQHHPEFARKVMSFAYQTTSAIHPTTHVMNLGHGAAFVDFSGFPDGLNQFPLDPTWSSIGT